MRHLIHRFCAEMFKSIYHTNVTISIYTSMEMLAPTNAKGRFKFVQCLSHSLTFVIVYFHQWLICNENDLGVAFNHFHNKLLMQLMKHWYYWLRWWWRWWMYSHPKLFSRIIFPPITLHLSLYPCLLLCSSFHVTIVLLRFSFFIYKLYLCPCTKTNQSNFLYYLLMTFPISNTYLFVRCSKVYQSIQIILLSLS